MLTVAAGILGVFAALRLPIDAVPDITTNNVVINTVYPSMSPLEVEKQITTPIETALAGIPGLELMRSNSWNGFSQITTTFADDVDVYFARTQVSEHLAEARELLPAGADPRLGGVTTGLGDIYYFTVEFEHPAGQGAVLRDGVPGWQSDGSYLTPEGEHLTDDFQRAVYLRTVTDWIIRPQLARVKDIASVDVQGGYTKQYHVQPDPMKLIAYGLTFKDLTEALEKNNANLGAGRIEHKGEAYIVRAIGRIESPEQIAAIPIGQHSPPVFVRDVATIALGKEIRSGAGTLNGNEVVLAVAQMLIGANSRTVAAAADEKLHSIKLPPDVRARTVLSRTKLVDSTIRTVFTNLAEGAALVVIILFLLLGNFRAAFIAALAIPFSMLIAACGMLEGKTSGNLMSLGAIDFGLIVDGAVIIVENCLRMLGARQHELGRKLTRDERLDVVLEASLQVRSATAFGEAIIIIVYLPILALTGVAGKMFRPMALTVILALLAAFVLSLTFIPAMIAILMGGRVRERENFIVRFVQLLYRPLLWGALRLRFILVPAAIAGFAASLLLLRQPDEDHPDRLGRDFIPKLDEGDVLVIAKRAPSTGLTESVRIQRALEKALIEISEVQFVTSKVGTGDAATDPIPLSDADTFIILKPREQWKNPHRSKKSLLKEIESTIEDVPGNTYEFVQPIEDRFNELIAGVRTDVGVQVFGEDFDLTVRAAQSIYHIVRKMGAVDVAEPKGIEGLPTLQIRIDRAACARYGLAAADVQDIVAIAIGGREAGVIFEGERRFDILVRLSEKLRSDIDSLRELPIPLPKSEPDSSAKDKPSLAAPEPRPGYIPLAAVAQIEITQGPNEIIHEDGKRSVVVSFNVRGRDIGSFVEEARRRVDASVAPKLPAGTYIEWGGQFQTMNETWKRLMVIVPVGFLLIFALLFTTFNSMKHALIVFTGVPLALSGGIIALWLRRGHWSGSEWTPEMNLSISAGVGFIALSGVAVLNGLVMVTFINQLRREGVPLEEAIIRGCLTRLRPVLMTALVASLGFVPMALATGAGAEVQKPLATVVIGGIVSSTLLTLFILPALYRLVHRRQRQQTRAELQ